MDRFSSGPRFYSPECVELQNSANFAFRGFYEVRRSFGANWPHGGLIRGEESLRAVAT